MLDKFFIFFLFVIPCIHISGQESIKWLSLETAVKLQQIEKRKIFIDIHTDWCGWCRKMERINYHAPENIKYINTHFYAVKLNAESKENITFNGKSYRYVKSGNNGYHELALALTRGKLSYPSVVFLDDNLNIIQPIQGFVERDKFSKILVYFALDKYKKMPWATFEREFFNEADLVKEY